MKEHEFAMYRGDEFLGSGTAKELAEKWGVLPGHIRYLYMKFGLRLDEVLDFIENYGVSASTEGFDKTASRDKAKQAITSLIKELVAEAKPGRADTQIWRENPDDAWDMAIDQFEQNLLKALEEV